MADPIESAEDFAGRLWPLETVEEIAPLILARDAAVRREALEWAAAVCERRGENTYLEATAAAYRNVAAVFRERAEEWRLGGFHRKDSALADSEEP